jgi:HK97 family phage portal protein
MSDEPTTDVIDATAGDSLNRDVVYTVGETRDADDALWTTSGFGGPSIAEFFGLTSPYRVTGRQALEQAAALICVDVLAQDISKAPLHLKARLRGGGDRVVEPGDHPIAGMLALEPNERHTWPEFISMMVYHLALSSNSYSYLQRDRQGDITALVPVMPGRVQERINAQSYETFYDINASTLQELALLRQPFITAPERDVLHIRQRMLDGFWGYSTLTAGGRSLSIGKDLDYYQRTQFAGSAADRGYFSRPAEQGKIDDDVFRRIKSQLKKLVQRARDGEAILLEDGITYKEFTVNATQAELIKALDKHIETICKLWRMPPHKAMHLTAVKYENLTAMEKVYVRDTLIPLVSLIEARLSKMLLSKNERMQLFFEFDRDAMAIFDEAQLREDVKMMLDRSAIELDEARDALGWNPMPGGRGQRRIVPVNTVLVDRNDEVVVSGAKAQGKEPSAQQDEQPPAEQPADDSEKTLRLVASRD